MEAVSFAYRTELLSAERKNEEEITPELISGVLRYIEALNESPLNLQGGRKLIRDVSDPCNQPPKIVDKGVTSQVLSAPNGKLTVLKYVFKPVSKVAIHTHEESTEWQLFFGSGEIFLNGRIIPVERGTLVRVVPGDLHSTRNRTDQELIRAVVYTPAQNSSDYFPASKDMQKGW